MLLNLEATAGDKTTWGEVKERRCAEVEEDPPMWLSRLEKENQSKQPAPQGEVRPLAKQSSSH
jgi:hypothetical protein